MVLGLSRKFIYFNDDVFLGAPVLPEDFVLTSGAQKVGPKAFRDRGRDSHTLRQGTAYKSGEEGFAGSSQA
jgi:hypothetical protein